MYIKRLIICEVLPIVILLTFGRYGWKLYAAKMLAEPIPAKGSLSLWEWVDGQEIIHNIDNNYKCN